MKLDNDFREWLIKHKNVTLQKFDNLNEVLQEEVYQVYKNEKTVESILK